MHTLIFGSKGQLGKDLVARFEQDGPVTGFDLPELDISDPRAVQAAMRETQPGLVINAAAYTDVDGAEDDPDAAYLANESGARHIAEAAAQARVPVVYYGTDYVFPGGHKAPYEPDNPIEPRGVYAQSKALGESATRAATPHHFVVRTAWLYGPGGNNFVEKILRAAAEQPRLRVVDDEVGSPTHTWDLAEATRALCVTRAYGTYHAVNRGRCSRFEFAREILRVAGVTTPLDACKASEYPRKAPRPAIAVLSTTKLTAACGYKMRLWQPALKHYMQRREATA